MSHCVKSYGYFCQILALFHTTHQIWSCHVTQDANFEKFLFCPNSTFNIRKSKKISIGKALYFRSYQPKPSRGGGNTPFPSVFRVKSIPFKLPNLGRLSEVRIHKLNQFNSQIQNPVNLTTGIKATFCKKTGFRMHIGKFVATKTEMLRKYTLKCFQKLSRINYLPTLYDNRCEFQFSFSSIENDFFNSVARRQSNDLYRSKSLKNTMF